MLIRGGDIAGARRLLEEPAGAGDGEALFVLAETYDPNVLAALASKGVTAEVGKARQLYEAAQSKDIEAAARRLRELR